MKNKVGHYIIRNSSEDTTINKDWSNSRTQTHEVKLTKL